ncbi:MAG: Asp-tRNA(Asn)/Glu-tRNA(Gln) amidotransferase subunit GatC [Acidobacteriia bacterium]|nr:Asp-tRNA(Asn)/Glu-tRNA(Gln) amidotransferase subunit GatC [Terriglobia bacterium]
MSISVEEVRYVARLAHLDLSAAEVQEFALQLSDILQHMEAMKDVATDDVEPIMQVLDPAVGGALTTPLRDDAVQVSFGTRLAISNAPDPCDPYFRVPKVIAER